MSFAVRYSLCLALPASLDLTANAIFSVLSGEPGYFLWALAYDLVFLVGLNIVLARQLLFRPVRRLLAGADSPGARSALNHLAGRSALWAAGVYIVFLPFGFFFSPVAGSYGGAFSVPLDYVYFIAAIFAVSAGYLVFFLVNGVVTRIKLDIFERLGWIIPASGAHIRRRLTAAIGVLALVPLGVLAAEIFWFDQYRNGGGLDLPIEQAVMMDVLVSLLITAIVLWFLPSTLTRPIDILGRAMNRVSDGRLETRAPVTSNDEIGQLTTRFNEMVVGLEERQRIRETFGKYVPEAVAEKLIRDPDMIDAVDREATIMFTDITGFTGITERLTPAETIAMLNEYFHVVLEPIREAGGAVNAFIGDSVFASFNVPAPDRDHAASAIRAALEMERLLKDRSFGPHGDIRLETRIGINTGMVAAGAVGAGDRLGYTILGDAVNVAARLEALVKEVGGPILVSGATRRQAGDGFGYERVGEVTVRGRAETTEVWRVTGG